MPKDGFAAEHREWLVKYSTDYRTLSEVRMLHEATHVERISDEVDLITFPADLNEEEIVTFFENDASIEYAEPNYERFLFAPVNDPHYDNQWWIPYVKAESMWTQMSAQQKKVVVAVIDTGIDVNHEDLKSRIVAEGFNFPSEDENVTDTNGHGTQVAGVIAAELNNGKGIAGTSGPFEVSILPLKVLQPDGKIKVSNVVKAINYAIDKKVDVINISLGDVSHSTAEKEAIQRATYAGIVVVAAAGNSAETGNKINYPASYEEVISVGAIDNKSERASFSNYNAYVDLVAPGKGIYTTSPYHSYKSVNGTSFAAPIVSGTVAMMKGLRPALTKEEVHHLLTTTAIDLGPVGRDDQFGAGALNIEQLMTYFEVDVSPTFKGDFRDMFVEEDHVFKVTFNQPLQLNADYSNKIAISKDVEGEQLVYSFEVEVDKKAPEKDKLLITPKAKWTPGEHYLTITKDMYNYNGQTLKKNVRMRFVVE